MRIKKIISLNTLNELLKIVFGDGSPEHPIKSNTFYHYRVYEDESMYTATMTVYFVKWKVLKSTIYLDIVVVSDKVSKDVVDVVELKDRIFSNIKKTITGWGRFQDEISIILKNNLCLGLD